MSDPPAIEKSHNEDTTRQRANVTAEEVKEAKRELKQAIKGSQEVLDSATTVFPFTLFPDTITIDRAKLTITHRKFFNVANVMSIRVEDILNVTADVGPFFGSLKILSRALNPDKPYIVNYLWRDDAIKIKKIMQGYVIAMQKDIDLTPLTTPELAAMLVELGADDHQS
jgi:hypothetical protein